MHQQRGQLLTGTDACTQPLPASKRWAGLYQVGLRQENRRTASQAFPFSTKTFNLGHISVYEQTEFLCVFFAAME